jgi:hypothetical protein
VTSWAPPAGPVAYWVKGAGGQQMTADLKPGPLDVADDGLAAVRRTLDGFTEPPAASLRANFLL